MPWGPGDWSFDKHPGGYHTLIKPDLKAPVSQHCSKAALPPVDTRLLSSLLLQFGGPPLSPLIPLLCKFHFWCLQTWPPQHLSCVWTAGHEGKVPEDVDPNVASGETTPPAALLEGGRGLFLFYVLFDRWVILSRSFYFGEWAWSVWVLNMWGGCSSQALTQVLPGERLADQLSEWSNAAGPPTDSLYWASTVSWLCAECFYHVGSFLITQEPTEGERVLLLPL